MVEAMSLISSFLFYLMDHIWVLYTGGSILGCVIILWILDRLFHVFDVLKR